VNMAEECHEPRRIFPKIMLSGLTITGIIYVLVAICSVALVPVGPLAASDTPLVEVVRAGAPGIPADAVLPFISMFAVANSALINMLMASRLLYGMANQAVLPRPLARVHPFRRTPWVAIVFTTLISFALISYVSLDESSDVVSALGGTTSLLLLAVFTIVNVAVLVLRRDTVDADHFRAPPGLPVVGALTSLYLVLPFSGRDTIQYELAGLLLVLGLVLYGITVLLNRRLGVKQTTLDPAKLDG
jgi:APA family basic amino acid/polyamine antiporter